LPPKVLQSASVFCVRRFPSSNLRCGHFNDLLRQLDAFAIIGDKVGCSVTLTDDSDEQIPICVAQHRNVRNEGLLSTIVFVPHCSMEGSPGRLMILDWWRVTTTNSSAAAGQAKPMNVESTAAKIIWYSRPPGGGILAREATIETLQI
jgi:hypothetical protein